LKYNTVYVVQKINNYIKDESTNNLMRSRPKYTPLHRNFEELGSYIFAFLLDFGSYRDIQRHRNCILSMPMLTYAKFHPWYFERYSLELQSKITVLLESIRTEYAVSAETQYILPMGCVVECILISSLPQTVYLAELRSGTTVHPTLRPIAQSMGDVIIEGFPGISLHVNRDESEFNIKRGEQTIKEKP
jgi:hypothetical protein